jgi:hypothetical protein
MSVHRIRLRGPWDYAVLAGEGAGPLPPSGRAKMPADWQSLFGADFRGRGQFRRGFHQPTGVEGSQRVWLSIDAGPAFSIDAVALNGTPLEVANASALRIDITDLLRPHNELVLELGLAHGGQAPAEELTILDQVALEIEPNP